MCTMYVGTSTVHGYCKGYAGSFKFTRESWLYLCHFVSQKRSQVYLLIFRNQRSSSQLDVQDSETERSGSNNKDMN